MRQRVRSAPGLASRGWPADRERTREFTHLIKGAVQGCREDYNREHSVTHMRKWSSLILALAAGVAVWLAYGRKSASPTSQPTGIAPAQKKAGKPPLVEPRPKEPSEETILNPAENALRPVPMLDTASPVYQSALVLLENRFIRLLERETSAQSWPPDHLMEVANRLAKLQLVLAMYEASIAEYTMVENKAVIVIPAYPREGEVFQTQVQALLLPDFGGEDFKRELSQRFGRYGKYAQQLEVGIGMQTIEAKAQSFFHVLHKIDIPEGGMVTGSGLTEDYLGGYAPFIGAFPRN
jgi:hypothetical protein